MILSFAEFEVDTELYELRKNGRPRSVEPMVFDLIAHFAKHPDQVFTRDELMDSVWNGRVVSDATVSTCVKSARKALGDSGDTQRYIKTVRGRGFRFTTEVSQRQTGATEKPRPQTTSTEHAGNTGPSLLVLPFRTLSDNPDIARFANGLTADLNTILTRIPLLRLSTQTAEYIGREVMPTAREIHEDLRVDYVLEGSLQELAGRFRINAQLSDTRSGFCLWAEQFSIPGPIGDALDRGVIAIIGKLEPQLHRAIYNTVRASDGAPNARELYLEASGILALKGWRHESFSVAADLLRRSWKQDRAFALAPSYLSLVMGLGHRVGLVRDRERAKTEALEAAERSLELDSMDSNVLGFSGCALGDIGYVDRSLPILRNAVELNPANAQAWAALGSVCLIRGRLDEAVAHLSHGIEISPLDSRLSIWGALLAVALMLSNDPDAARRQGELACQRDDRTYMPRVVLAAVHLARDDRDSALRALKDAYRIKPDLSATQIGSLVGRTLADGLIALSDNGNPSSP